MKKVTPQKAFDRMLDIQQVHRSVTAKASQLDGNFQVHRSTLQAWATWLRAIDETSLAATWTAAALAAVQYNREQPKKHESDANVPDPVPHGTWYSPAQREMLEAAQLADHTGREQAHAIVAVNASWQIDYWQEKIDQIDMTARRAESKLETITTLKYKYKHLYKQCIANWLRGTVQTKCALAAHLFPLRDELRNMQLNLIALEWKERTKAVRTMKQAYTGPAYRCN